MKDGNSDNDQGISFETTIQELPTTTEIDTTISDTLEVAPKDTLEQTEQPTSDSLLTKEVTNEEQYYLISGSFSVEDNALTYMKELQEKGIEAFNSGKKGRFYCVGIGIYTTFEEAEKAKVEFMENNPGSEGWVWKK